MLTGPLLVCLCLFLVQRHRTMKISSMENQPNLPFTPQTDDEIDIRQVLGALASKSLIQKSLLQLFYCQEYTLT